MDEAVRKELGELNARFAGLEERVNGLAQRTAEQGRLVDTVHRLALSMERMTLEQRSLRADVDEMRGVAKKRWEVVATEGLRLLVAAAVGAIFARMGIA